VRFLRETPNKTGYDFSWKLPKLGDGELEQV
jgi:hypothetical protein